jgi:molybdate/tungstate transport system ATP-binding protein
MLELEKLERSYPGSGFSLGPLSLSVDEEVLAVLGPSGCGKSTLLGLVAGIERPDAGRVRLYGADLTDRPPERRDVGLVFQDGALFPHMTARENVAYAADGPERVASLAETLEIDDVLDRPASALSGGERQRVSLARALAARPAALLLDEPLANLDAPAKRRLRGELRELLAALSIPVVYVTHDQHQATVLGDRVAVLNDGRLEQVAPPEQLLLRPASPFVAAFTGGVNVFDAEVAAVDAEGVGLRWGEHVLRAASVAPEVAPGSAVQFTVRPEYITLEEAGPNALAGRLADSQFDGRSYRLTVRVDGADAAVAVDVPPPRYEALGLTEGSPVRLRLPPESVHVIA